MFRCLLFLLVFSTGALAEPVRFTHGKLTVPTYSFRRSEIVAPLFKSIENAGHYPYTVLDWNSRIEKPESVEYESLVLENEYLRVTFLPELGGRIYSAFDKIAKREIFYRPSVIKPGRYNQRGGWPVGNLELYGPFDAHMLTWPGEPWAWACERPPGRKRNGCSQPRRPFFPGQDLAVCHFAAKARVPGNHHPAPQQEPSSESLPDLDKRRCRCHGREPVCISNDENDRSR